MIQNSTESRAAVSSRVTKDTTVAVDAGIGAGTEADTPVQFCDVTGMWTWNVPSDRTEVSG
ncbi:hypothetical protein C481_11610 [Natrialba asiatica DSM 12278]|uniref:Uncharacterized protein n=1 Tax=Natrialba asiatica (strain ATCC 700177 / DSM 12278 / JCM 9576 / FERM P-10747 / NBRC 102637 / 172P1) TaxID=29540 RepID=M0ARB9_NATA1|nr:hypothetical protein C481_11610 [Natrialba asiatica DSM 12278]